MREKNKEKLIQDALNMLEDELILEADEIREKSVNTTVERSSITEKSKLTGVKTITGRKFWRYITSFAACIAVFFIAGSVWNEIIVPNQADESIVEECANEEVEADLDKSEYSLEKNNDKERDELNEIPDISEVAQSESQIQLGSQEVIHLPNQEVDAALVESLARVSIPAMKVELGVQKDVQADMLAFFIYEGRSYVQDQYYKEGFALLGDYVGTSVGLIDEWTSEDGYVDYAGSISGDFYEVKGYDPAFMLCMKFDDGAVETFINNNGISLGKGSDLIVDRLHLKDNVEKVSYKTQKEWDTSLQNEKNHVLPEEYDVLMNQFLDAFSDGNFEYINTSLDVNGTGSYHHNEDNYHLTFHTKDGLNFDFVLYEDGYVRFQGFGGVCVQIGSEIYEELILVLKEGGL